MNKVNLLNLTYDELSNYVKEMGLPKFRAKQIRSNLYKGIPGFFEMTDLSMDMRERLSKVASTGALKISQKLVSNLDGTIKYLFDLGDGNIIESVLMKYKYGYTACISSQVGCKMGCTFCASSGVSFGRNLSSGEMLSQVLSMQRDVGEEVGRIVIMGIGEPLDNYIDVVKFLREAGNPDGLNISFRKLSLSTCGVVPGINRLAEENMPITLSVSLHSPFEDERTSLMPINRKYPIKELMIACRAYVEKTGRRITFEYAMISGVNDKKEHALKLCDLLKGMLCHVNLIPINKIENSKYQRAKKDNVTRFENELMRKGISVTVRRELGPDIEAACGQLRRTEV